MSKRFEHQASHFSDIKRQKLATEATSTNTHDAPFDIPNAFPGREGRGSSEEENGSNAMANALSDEENDATSEHSSATTFGRNKRQSSMESARSISSTVDFETIRYRNAMKSKYGIDFEEEGEDDEGVRLRAEMYGNDEQHQNEASRGNDDDISDAEFSSRIAKQVLTQKNQAGSTAIKTHDDMFDSDNSTTNKFHIASARSKRNHNEKEDFELANYRQRMAKIMGSTEGERIESLVEPRFNPNAMEFRERGEMTKGEKNDDAWAAELDERYEDENLKEVALDSDEEFDLVTGRKASVVRVRKVKIPFREVSIRQCVLES